MRAFGLAIALVVTVAACASTESSTSEDRTNKEEPPKVDDDEPNAGPPCQVSDVRGSLPGVVVSIAADGCTFKSGRGGDFRYTVTVDANAPTMTTVASPSCGHCTQRSSDPLSWLSARVEGNDARYCVCDTGCCPPDRDSTVQLRPGTATGVLHWPGKEWGGPSDTNEPLGAAFAPGDYAVHVVVADQSGRSVDAVLPIHVVP